MFEIILREDFETNTYISDSNEVFEPMAVTRVPCALCEEDSYDYYYESDDRIICDACVEIDNS